MRTKNRVFFVFFILFIVLFFTICIVCEFIIYTFALYSKNSYNMAKSKFIEITQTETVSPDGEVINELSQRQYKTISYEKEPNYVKLYTDDISRLFQLPSSASDVLSCLVKYMTYKTNIVVLYGPVKTAICKELNMQKNTLNKAIDNLFKKGLIIRVSHACYMIDPQLFGKGSWSDVSSMRMMIQYDEKGNKTIKTELFKQDKKLESFEKKISQKQAIDDPRQRNLLDAIAEAESVK